MDVGVSAAAVGVLMESGALDALPGFEGMADSDQAIYRGMAMGTVLTGAQMGNRLINGRPLPTLTGFADTLGYNAIMATGGYMAGMDSVLDSAESKMAFYGVVGAASVATDYGRKALASKVTKTKNKNDDMLLWVVAPFTQLSKATQ